MLRGFFNRCCTRNSWVRVNQISCRIGAATNFAIITILVFSFTLGTSAFDKAVCEKQAFLGIKQLIDFTYSNMVIGFQAIIDKFTELTVFFRVCWVVVVKVDKKAGEVFFMLSLHKCNLLFRCMAQLFSFKHNGGAMSVVSTNITTLVATMLLKTHPDICLDCFKNMPKMQWTIGVRQCAGNKNITRFFGVRISAHDVLKFLWNWLARKAATIAIFKQNFTCH